MTEQDVIYHGIYRPSGGCLILTETPAGEVTGMVAHVVKHSPTGLGWGYAGSGPADTARSLLIAALGDAAKCPECAGTQRTVYTAVRGGEVVDEVRPFDPACDADLDPEAVTGCWCDGGYRPLHYQEFKFEFVARWDRPPHEWRMARSQIRRWAATRMEWAR